MIDVVRQLTLAEQKNILAVCREVIAEAPLFVKTMPTGAAFRYKCTSAGPYGWISDRKGFRYVETHPVTGQAFPKIPSPIEQIAIEAAAGCGLALRPETALINWYDPDSSLGLHQDRTEISRAPVVSISVGDDCVFIIGGLKRKGPKRELILHSGDVLIMGAEDRLVFHGVKKILPGTAPAELGLENPGRTQYHRASGLRLMDTTAEIAQLEETLRDQGTPERAAYEKAYLKSALQHYGVRVPDLRRIARSWLKTQHDCSIDDIADMAAALWDSDWHEEKSLAIMLLEYRSADLSMAQMPLIERMINEAATWAHLDEIAVHLVGALIDHDPQTLDYLPQWAESGNFWVRRTALLAQNSQFRRGDGDFALFTRLAVPMFEEGREWSKDERFFIRKAIGWTLRELTKTRPEQVFEFVQQHRGQMSGLTFREATRNLPSELRDRL